VTRSPNFSKRSSRLAAAGSEVENRLVFDELDSTQACALRLIEQVDAEEITLPTTLIIAGRQTHGRGRAERSWESPPGGLYLSWVASGLDQQLIARLPMIAAAAAAEAVIRLGIDSVALKWPNDLMVDGAKLAGLLVHARHGAVTWVAIGLGINLETTPSIDPGGAGSATSVADHLPPGDPDGWAELLIRIFCEGMAEGIATPDEKLELWRTRLIHRPGDGLTVRLGDGSQTRGCFSGLTKDGHLRLDVDGDEQVISSGDVVEWSA